MKKKKSFTLVELLVVISILAILSGIGVIGYNAYKTKTKRNADIYTSNLMDNAVTYYLVNNQINTLNDVYLALNQNELLDDLKPLISTNKYVYDNETKNILLIDKNENIINNKLSSSKDNWLYLDKEITLDEVEASEVSFNELFK